MLILYPKDGRVLRFEVSRFVYTAALSACYHLQLEVPDRDQRLQEESSLLFCPATLQFADNTGASQSVSGRITALTQRLDPVKKQVFYSIEIEPALALLRLEQEIQGYPQQSPLEIARELVQNLSQAQGLTDYADFQVTLPWLTARRQSDEIDFEENRLVYFNTLLNFARYYFYQEEASERLVVIDRPELLPCRDQVIFADPARKEDLHNAAPVFYVFALQQQDCNLRSRPVYFDPNRPQAARQFLTETDPLVVELAGYAPADQYDFIRAKLSEQLQHACKTYRFKSYYSRLQTGERITVQSAASSGTVAAFIESLRIEGHYQHDRWRFETEGILRPYTSDGLWLGAPQLRRKLPALLTGGLLQPENQVNDSGEYRVKLPLGFNPGQETPVFNVRELQETVTRDGGASHAVSGNSATVLFTRDGLPADLLLAGSLVDSRRPSHINSETYREAGVALAGGLKLHLRRRDEASSYGETGALLTDSQGNAAHLTLGANAQTLNEEGERAHGIRQQSTGYAKRVVAGNDYDTVGDPDNPVTQRTLVKENGQTLHSTQTHVGAGTYRQTYYTEATGIKADHTPAPAETAQPNPAIAHYFYVLPVSTDLGALADQLFGSDPAAQKSLFTHLNLQAYGATLSSGTWAYLPVRQSYQAADITAVHNALTRIQTQTDQDHTESLESYGLWHQVFGWNFDNTLSFAGAYFETTSEQINKQLEAISKTLNEIGQINQQAQPENLANDSAQAALLQEQTRIKGEALHEKINNLIKTFAEPDISFKSDFEKDTGLTYSRSILGIKANGLTNEDLQKLTELKSQTIALAAGTKAIGYAGIALDGIENMQDIYETCSKYGSNSKLCHKAAIGDTANFVTGTFAGDRAAKAVTQWAGCNATLDFETAGTGILLCTVAIGLASSAAGTIVGKIGKIGTEAAYDHFSSSKTESSDSLTNTGIIYTQSFNINGE